MDSASLMLTGATLWMLRKRIQEEQTGTIESVEKASNAIEQKTINDPNLPSSTIKAAQKTVPRSDQDQGINPQVSTTDKGDILKKLNASKAAATEYNQPADVSGVMLDCRMNN